ncbi:hypothetical protein ANN_05831 [Periplaneta americana]|uniref:Uncharacterized protein n=1 Tax=Periplaneta americana TaxID=6978 RepID=A0ABQ8TBW3_PERAM|nr:hypothetical protein ANN_05831 [Periplaneta americana]
MFGAKRDEITGEWRKLHNAELHALYSSPDIIWNIKSRRLRWAGHVARMGEFRNAYRVLVGRPEGKIPLGRPRHRWEDNIKMALREILPSNLTAAEQVRTELSRWESNYVDVAALRSRAELAERDQEALADKVALLERRVQGTVMLRYSNRTGSNDIASNPWIARYYGDEKNVKIAAAETVCGEPQPDCLQGLDQLL